VREVGSEITWDKADEGQQLSFRTHAAKFGEGVRPRRIAPTTLAVDFGAVWVPATGGVVRMDPRSMQPIDFIPTGDIRAIASSGYASMYAAVETEGRGLGVASWDSGPGGGMLRVAVIDPTPGAADTVLGSGSAVGFAELLYLTRTYPDRPAELLGISPANGTVEVITRMGGPNTRLVVDRISSDSARDLWVGSSDGVLRHIHTNGTVTDIDLDGPVLDVAATDPEHIWLAVGRNGRHPRPMRVTAATHRVSADLSYINASEIAVEARNEAGYRVMTSGESSAADGQVGLALIIDDTGRAFTTSTAHVAEAVGLTFGLADERDAFAVSPSSGDLVRFVPEFGD
jgi:hypothetical protein